VTNESDSVQAESARKNESDIVNHFNQCETHRPRPGFFVGFVCIDNATFRVEEALAAAAGFRSQEGVKAEVVRADIVAQLHKPKRAIIFSENSKKKYLQSGLFLRSFVNTPFENI
jgi:hypothetical protein